MKKIILSILSILFITAQASFARYIEFNDIYNNENVIYDCENQIWTNELPKTTTEDSDQTDEDTEIKDITENQNLIILTKQRTSGIGSYSIYLQKKSPVIKLDADYEFIKDGQFIAINNSNLKYYKVIYDGSKFIQQPLKEDEIKTLFPKAQIVKISEFKNDLYTTKKGLFRFKTIILVNDTDRVFYKYSYKPPRVQSTELSGLIRTARYGKIKFSHYGDKENSLTIRIIH